MARKQMFRPSIRPSGQSSASRQSNSAGDDNLISTWKRRITAANKLYNDWRKRYKVEALEKYYEGFQWAGQEDDDSNPYVLNMFYSTIETKMPTLIFDCPHFVITPRPDQIVEDPDEAFLSSQNLQDALNTYVDQENNNFNSNVEAPIMDSWFGFGIIESGYSADWINNPKAPKPGRPDNKDQSEQHNRIKIPFKLPVNERVFTKYIPYDQFRVAPGAQRELWELDWCGYYEFYHVDDLRTIKNFDRYDYQGGLGEDELLTISDGISKHDSDFVLSGQRDYVLVWKIWDNRNKKAIVFVPGYDVIIYEKPFKEFPFTSLRFRKPKRGFYPIPPTFNWISPQNELNEFRETNRTHRRRFRRMYILLTSAGVDRTEAEKLINGPDGGIIEADRENALQPVPNADLGASHNISEQVTREDFNIISATTNNQRGGNDRETATAANIQNERATVRESRERTIIALFIQSLGKSILQIIKNRFVNEFSVQSEPADIMKPTGDDVGTMTTPIYRKVDPVTDFGSKSFDFDVVLQIETMSPVANSEEKTKFLEFIGLMAKFPVFSLDPTLVREMAFRVGYRNEKVIRHFMQMAQLMMIGQMAQAQQSVAQLAGPQDQSGQQAVAQMTPTDNEQTAQNLDSQLAVQ